MVFVYQRKWNCKIIIISIFAIPQKAGMTNNYKSIK